MRLFKYLLFPFVLLHRIYIRKRNRKWAVNAPMKLANFYYKRVMKHNINWQNPQDLNEKINWLKFYSDTEIWTELADKYLVRKYIEDKGFKDILVDLYGVWENPEDIDFDSLPHSFVLKTNHACGTVLIIKDKQQINQEEIKQKLKEWLKLRMGLQTVEPHYLKIKPLIIAEELLEPKNGEIIDYKIFTASGVPELVLVCSDREIGVGCKLSMYDTQWNFTPEKITGIHKKDGVRQIPKPKSFEKMLAISKVLSKGFPQVRVDFYDIDGRLYFGELTFTSQGGYMNYISKEELLRIGRKVILPSKLSSRL